MTNAPRDDAAIRSASMLPLIPIRPRDLLGTLPELLNHAGRHPGIAVSALRALVSDLVDVARGASPYDVSSDNLRFADPRWRSSGYHKRMLQSWLAFDKRLSEWISNGALDEAEQKRLQFFLKLLLSASSPANFVLSNPEVLEHTRQTRGRNLVQGATRYLKDIRTNHGLPTHVDKSVFEVGRNLAITPGKVVFRNELLELIRYSPSTDQVYEAPVVLIPSFINRGYIFDLKPGRSTVEYLVGEGFSVYLIYWVNAAGKRHRDKGLDEYVQAIIDTLDFARATAGHETINLGGICGGGHLAATCCGVLNGQGRDWANTLTVISYVFDPDPTETDAGTLVTENSVNAAKALFRARGAYDKATVSWTMNLLQPERLIWSTVVDHYLLGKDPSTSEVMYWMSDQVNVPEKLMCDLLDLTLDRSLTKAGELIVLGVPIDLRNVHVDHYHVAPYFDHVMAWQGVYRNRKLLSGHSEVVLTNGGHITPCITPLNHTKARYFVGSRNDDDPQVWLDHASEHVGSWWPHWSAWLGTRSGSRIPASTIRDLETLGDAPGTYVKH